MTTSRAKLGPGQRLAKSSGTEAELINENSINRMQLYINYRVYNIRYFF